MRFFAGKLPLGEQYAKIVHDFPQYGYLDNIVARMICQNPEDRIGEAFQIRQRILSAQNEAAIRLKISQIDGAAVSQVTVDDPLAISPPIIVNAEWERDILTITFNQNITDNWIELGLHKMGSYTSPLGVGPETVQFYGKIAKINCKGNQPQTVINCLKEWLPAATKMYKYYSEQIEQQRQMREARELEAKRIEEERRLQINSNLRF